jgi:preprotein translocase subunit SecG
MITAISLWLVATVLLYRALFSGVGMEMVPKSRRARAREILTRIGVVIGFPFLGLWLIAAIAMEKLGLVRKEEVIE